MQRRQQDIKDNPVVGINLAVNVIYHIHFAAWHALNYLNGQEDKLIEARTNTSGQDNS